MGKIFNKDNEIIWICSIFGVLLLIGFTVFMRNVVIPEYKNEYEDKTKYLYEITIDEKKYTKGRKKAMELFIRPIEEWEIKEND